MVLQKSNGFLPENKGVNIHHDNRLKLSRPGSSEMLCSDLSRKRVWIVKQPPHAFLDYNADILVLFLKKLWRCVGQQEQKKRDFLC